MNKSKLPTPLRLSDYEAIEETIRASARGRWFLEEFADRNRGADTHVLLDALRKLESSINRQRQAPEIQKFRLDLMEMSKAISRTRQEIASIKPSDENCHIEDATEELDAIVRATEQATHDILEAAEDIQEAAWLLRENGADGDTCTKLDMRATDIYSACSFQDITGQRTSKVVNVLRYLEARVNAMIDIWGLDSFDQSSAEHHNVIPSRDPRADSHLLNGPQREGAGLEQIDIDDLLQIAPKEIPTVSESETGIIVQEYIQQRDDEEIMAIPQPEAEFVANMDFQQQDEVEIDIEKWSPVQASNEMISEDPASEEQPRSDQTDVPRGNDPETASDVVQADSFDTPSNTTLQSLGSNGRAVLFS